MKKQKSKGVTEIEIVSSEPTALVESETLSDQATTTGKAETINGNSEAAIHESDLPSLPAEAGDDLAPDVEQSTVTAPSRIARMAQESRLKYMAPVYAKRLGDMIDIMKSYLDRGEGTSHEIQKRIKALETLCGYVKTELHEVAAEYALKHGIRSSLLQGGFGYPSLTGAHFDYIVTVFPHRTAEMRELIYQRRMTAWKTTDRTPKLPESSNEEEGQEPHESDAA